MPPGSRNPFDHPTLDLLIALLKWAKRAGYHLLPDIGPQIRAIENGLRYLKVRAQWLRNEFIDTEAVRGALGEQGGLELEAWFYSLWNQLEREAGALLVALTRLVYWGAVSGFRVDIHRQLNQAEREVVAVETDLADLVARALVGQIRVDEGYQTREVTPEFSAYGGDDETDHGVEEEATLPEVASSSNAERHNSEDIHPDQPSAHGTNRFDLNSTPTQALQSSTGRNGVLTRQLSGIVKTRAQNIANTEATASAQRHPQRPAADTRHPGPTTYLLRPLDLGVNHIAQSNSQHRTGGAGNVSNAAWRPGRDNFAQSTHQLRANALGHVGAHNVAPRLGRNDYDEGSPRRTADVPFDWDQFKETLVGDQSLFRDLNIINDEFLEGMRRLTSAGELDRAHTEDAPSVGVATGIDGDVDEGQVGRSDKRHADEWEVDEEQMGGGLVDGGQGDDGQRDRGQGDRGHGDRGHGDRGHGGDGRGDRKPGDNGQGEKDQPYEEKKDEEQNDQAQADEEQAVEQQADEVRAVKEQADEEQTDGEKAGGVQTDGVQKDGVQLDGIQGNDLRGDGGQRHGVQANTGHLVVPEAGNGGVGDGPDGMSKWQRIWMTMKAGAKAGLKAVFSNRN